MTSNEDSAARRSGPDILVGIGLVVVALVFRSKYHDSLTFSDGDGNVVPLGAALDFLVWSAALVLIVRGLLAAWWPGLVKVYRRYVS